MRSSWTWAALSGWSRPRTLWTWTSTSASCMEPDAIHIMKKSEYSNRYGDYSSFSNELEELSEIAEEEAE